MKNFISIVIVSGLIFVPSSALAKKDKTPSSLELQQIQSRDFEASKELVFASVMTVLQDSGYRIGSADKDTGLITGSGSTSGKLTWNPFVGIGQGKKTPVVSAFIEEINANYTKVRLNFVMAKVSTNNYGRNEGETPIYDADIYQDAFEKVSQAVFVRQAMKSTVQKEPTPAAIAQPVQAAPEVVAPK